MKNKKRGLTLKINLSNRWLYFLITLGILAIVSVGVYAVDTSQAWHPASQIEGVQERVTGTCAAGSSIRVISLTGTVTCEADTDTIGTAGPELYRVTASGCPSGGVTFSSTCTTPICCASCGNGGRPTYYRCDGTCSWQYTSSTTCSNTYLGKVLLT